MKVELVVKGIVIDAESGKLLLLKRSAEDSICPNEWENVGGSVESGESLEEALHREIMEEAGIEVAIGDLAYVIQLDIEGPMLIVVYFCKPRSKDVILSSEHSDWQWVDKDLSKTLLIEGIHNDFEKNGIYDMDWQS